MQIADFSTTYKRPKIRSHIIQLDNLSPEHENIKIVQLSDLHYCSDNKKLIQRVVKDVNNINPDLLLITGDFVNDEVYEIENMANELA